MKALERCKPLLGTYVEIQLEGDVSEDTLLDVSQAMFDEIVHVEALMSFHNPDSELSLINSTAHHRAWAASCEMQQVLELALQLSEATEGIFDISIAPELVRKGLLPDHEGRSDPLGNWKDISLQEGFVRFARPLQLDLGGIAKGFAVDQAIAVIPENISGTVNAGGDLRMTNWQGKPIAIRIPGHEHQVVECVMQAPAVATSACYYLDNVSTIISPKTRQPVQKKISYSVFASNCMLADALTKVAYLAPDRIDWLKQFGGDVFMLDERACVQQLAS